MSLPEQYAWLLKEPAPRMLLEALKMYGVAEVSGDGDNKTIIDWADEIGVYNLYKHDEIPWCGLFVGVVAKRAGKALPVNPLWARNWARWGGDCSPALGCVLVFARDSGGHVGLYVGEDDECFHVLGGNQGDKVCITRIRKARLVASREMYKNKPANIRPVVLSNNGEVSKNER